MDIVAAKGALDRLVRYAKTPFYKPIHVAEILHRDRVHRDINLSVHETYRVKSRRWRDDISRVLVGNTCTSNENWADSIFTKSNTAETLSVLGEANRKEPAAVEAYIYARYAERLRPLREAVASCDEADPKEFKLAAFMETFTNQSALRRSADKMFECVAFAVLRHLLEDVRPRVQVSFDLNAGNDNGVRGQFVHDILGATGDGEPALIHGTLYRAGVANAADRGVDIFSNFGPIVQVKHRHLTLDLAREIVESTDADRIVIVCKTIGQRVRNGMLNLDGQERVRAIITEDTLAAWYAVVLRSEPASDRIPSLLRRLRDELEREFPACKAGCIESFMASRSYDAALEWELEC